MKGVEKSDIKAASILKLAFLALRIFSDDKSYQLKSFLIRDISTIPEVFEKIIQIPTGCEH